MTRSTVALIRAPGGYGDALVGRGGVAALAARLGWGVAGRPFQQVIPSGGRVVVKPNWVLHANRVSHGLDPLITHPSIVRAVVEAVLASGAGQVVVGDAPLQSCDTARLWADTGLGPWAEALAARDGRFKGLRDFRRTRSRFVDGVLVQEEEQVALSEFVLVDLGQRSFLEPVSNGRGGFRVTQYDPRRMTTTHSAGRHRYLIARSLLEADVVVNLPKLKTHRKAGMTGALKNLVGINGNKEFLPHHRVGGSAGGGDCYPGRSVVKRTHEWLLDCQNSTSSHLMRRALNVPARACSLLSRLLVDELGIEGAWAGNDTVWRMCLDLNRILLYARSDGTLADVPQRRVLHIVDGVIAGQGDGPLAAERFALHALLASESGAAVDLVGASLLGYDWRLIPIVREAFGASTHQLAGCAPEEVVTVDASTGVPVGADSGWPQPVAYPLGWLSAVRSAGRSERPIGRGATRLPLEA